MLHTITLVGVVLAVTFRAPEHVRCEKPSPLKLDVALDGGKFRPRLSWRDVEGESGYMFERYRLVAGKWVNFTRSAVLKKDSTSKVDKPRVTDSKGTQTFKYRVRATGNVDNPWTDWVEVTVKND